MIRKLLKPITAYCTPSSAGEGAIIPMQGKAHRIVGISESGCTVTQVIGKNEGYVGRLNKERTEILFDQEHDWEPKAAV